MNQDRKGARSRRMRDEMVRLGEPNVSEMPNKLRRKVMSPADYSAFVDEGHREMLASSTLCALAKALIIKLQRITTEEFGRAAEKEERVALHNELVRLGVMEFDPDGYRVLKPE